MPRKDSLDRMIEAAVAKWKKSVGPTPDAVAGFEAIRDLLRKYERTGLKAKKQEFPPKYELALPARKRGEHIWEFATVAAVEDLVQFDLGPLGLDVELRNRVSPKLRKREYRPDDGFQLPNGGKPYLAEIAALIEAAYDWFQSAIVPERPRPPEQQLDQYLIELAADDDGPPPAAFESISAKPLMARLVKAFGRGPWKRATATASVLLPGWSKRCTVELHWYNAGPRRSENWKIRRFVKCHQVEEPCDTHLVYAAKSEFHASLQPGKSYRCTATLGRKFQAYVRIVDESGEEYWYPERFFTTRAP